MYIYIYMMKADGNDGWAISPKSEILFHFK
jgi:hypothetical protein